MIELIGFPGDPGVDVEVVARKWGIPREFAKATLDDAKRGRPRGRPRPSARRAAT